MPIQLDKILADIALEKVLHPNYPDAKKKEMDDAWIRVGKSNKLSVHEARSIFKVLQKKYDQEKSKGSTAWKLFNIMEEIHSKKVEVKTATVKQEEELDVPMEEDEEYEMLEVQEEEDHQAQQTPLPPRSTGSTSDGESPTKSNSPSESPEKEEKPQIKKFSAKATAISNISNAARAAAAVAAAKTPPPSEEKKLLNNLVCTRQLQTPTAAALNKKGITLKKTTTNTTPVSSTRASNAIAQAKNSLSQRGALDIGKTIQLPESIKRKLSEERSPTSATGATTPTQPQLKKINVGQPLAQQNKNDHSESQDNAITTTPSSSSSAAASASVHGINLITIPANLPNGLVTGGRGGGASSSTAATVASTTASTNGFSPRIEEIDFRNDIIFDAGQNGSVVAAQKNGVTTSDIVNVGNFDNALPPTFFKNLCNSSRYESLGLYVANVMNRLPPRSAAKLELGILRAITDVQSEELE